MLIWQSELFSMCLILKSCTNCKFTHQTVKSIYLQLLDSGVLKASRCKKSISQWCSFPQNLLLDFSSGLVRPPVWTELLPPVKFGSSGTECANVMDTIFCLRAPRYVWKESGQHRGPEVILMSGAAVKTTFDATGWGKKRNGFTARTKTGHRFVSTPIVDDLNQEWAEVSRIRSVIWINKR